MASQEIAGLPLRYTDAKAWDRAFAALETAFGVVDPPEEVARWKRVTEFDRTFAVYDGTRPVGMACAFSFEFGVPGGVRMPMAGVSAVGVVPTHRRRGILTGMMRHQLTSLHEDGGEPLAALFASEAAIYGRYGYGPATYRLSLSMPRNPRALRMPPGSDEVRLRLSEPDEDLADCAALYHRHVDDRPGTIALNEAWTEKMVLGDAPWNHGGVPLTRVLALRGDQVVGYARYRRTTERGPAGVSGDVRVRDLVADDIAAYAALWRFLLDLDLSTTVSCDAVPVDSPLRYLLHDVRSADPRLRDHLYLRLVDVGTALAGRRYSAPVDVVIDVSDEFCPWNAGRWRLCGDTKGATCARTTASADIELGARELGAAYLGGTSLRALGAAGLVTERATGALEVAASAFTHDPAPFCVYTF